MSLEITRTIIIFIISLMFKGSCFSSEGYIARWEMEQSWGLKAVTGSNIQAWPISCSVLLGIRQCDGKCQCILVNIGTLRSGNVLGTVQ